MWTIAAVNKKFDGPLGSYNGLTDVHLAHFFSQPSRRSHLKAAKLLPASKPHYLPSVWNPLPLAASSFHLHMNVIVGTSPFVLPMNLEMETSLLSAACLKITDDGFIVPEKNVKVELYLDEKKRKTYDILARSILQNAVHKEGSWNKRFCNYLEDISKMTAVDKARIKIRKKSGKVASELFYEHPVSPDFSFINGISRSPSNLISSYRNSLKPPTSAPATCLCFMNEGPQKVANIKRSVSAKQHSPYGVPLVLSESYKEQAQSLFNYYKTSKQKKRKRRSFNNSVGNSKAVEKKIFSDKCALSVSAPHQALKFSQCKIVMLYHGHLLLKEFQKALTQNVVIKQQHCGGTPVIIYKGKIQANESLSFFSLDHEGFFFSLIIFLNGIRELKLSSCCVFRYLPGRRLGGPNGTFSINKVEGGKPCLKCQYQQYENSEFKLISQSSEVSLETTKNKETPVVALNDIKDKTDCKISLDNYKPEEDHGSSTVQDDELVKTIDTESNADEVIEELLDDLPNQNIKEEITTEENIVNETSSSSFEEEIKENEESNNSVSSSNHSEISEKYVEEQKYCTISVDTSSSEDEGENQHIVTASVHESPDNS